MYGGSKFLIGLLLGISVIAWGISITQSDAMMSSMMYFYDPLALSIFVFIWTAGMAAMMFPAVIPMVTMYNKLTNRSNGSGKNGNGQIVYKNSEHEVENGDKKGDNWKSFGIVSASFLKLLLFVSSYLGIWALTGIVMLVGWTLIFDELLPQFGFSHTERQQLNVIFGSLLIISGIYQFSSLKSSCLGYCESPLSFFIRRWRDGVLGAIRMGAYHGLYCLGCCWPYFLLMVALGWMNVAWMGLFAVIIFVEKIWRRGGIWVARVTGVSFVVVGTLVTGGWISLVPDSMPNEKMMSMDMPSNMFVSGALDSLVE